MHTAQRIMRTVFDTVELLLAVRFAMALLGASVTAPVIAFWYVVTSPLIAPFAGIFPNIRYGAMVFEWQTVAAILGYAFLYYCVARLITLIFSMKRRTIA